MQAGGWPAGGSSTRAVSRKGSQTECNCSNSLGYFSGTSAGTRCPVSWVYSGKISIFQIIKSWPFSRDSSVGTVASLMKPGQSFAGIPIFYPDGTEICSDASETVSATTQQLQGPFPPWAHMSPQLEGRPQHQLCHGRRVLGVLVAQSTPERETWCKRRHKPSCGQHLQGNCVGEGVWVPSGVRGGSMVPSTCLPRLVNATAIKGLGLLQDGRLLSSQWMVKS